MGAGRLHAGRALDQLSAVPRSAESAGSAVVRTGESIRDVDVPVVGTVFEDAGDKVIEAGRGAEAQARESESDTAAVLLGLAVWLVPTLPLFAYGPTRMHRGRETRALRGLLRDHAGDPEPTGCSRCAPSRTCRTTACARSAYERTTASWPTRSWRARASNAGDAGALAAALARGLDQLEQGRLGRLDGRQREGLDGRPAPTPRPGSAGSASTLWTALGSACGRRLRREARADLGDAAGVGGLVGEERHDHLRQPRAQRRERRAEAAVADHRVGVRHDLGLRHPLLGVHVRGQRAEVGGVAARSRSS